VAPATRKSAGRRLPKVTCGPGIGIGGHGGTLTPLEEGRGTPGVKELIEDFGYGGVGEAVGFGHWFAGHEAGVGVQA
jgi:hypothetical protein